MVRFHNGVFNFRKCLINPFSLNKIIDRQWTWIGVDSLNIQLYCHRTSTNFDPSDLGDIQKCNGLLPCHRNSVQPHISRI